MISCLQEFIWIHRLISEIALWVELIDTRTGIFVWKSINWIKIDDVTRNTEYRTLLLNISVSQVSTKHTLIAHNLWKSILLSSMKKKWEKITCNAYLLLSKTGNDINSFSHSQSSIPNEMLFIHPSIYSYIQLRERHALISASNAKC